MDLESPRRRVHPAKGPVSRILSRAAIPLGAALPRTLISDLPGGSGTCSNHLGAPGRHAAESGFFGSRFPPYLVLLRVGFTLPSTLPPKRCALTAPFHPCPARSQVSESRPGAPMRRYVFCGTGRPRALTPASRTLSGTLPCGVRTFLSRAVRFAPGRRQRPPSPSARG